MKTLTLSLLLASLSVFANEPPLPPFILDQQKLAAGEYDFGGKTVTLRMEHKDAEWPKLTLTSGAAIRNGAIYSDWEAHISGKEVVATQFIFCGGYKCQMDFDSSTFLECDFSKRHSASASRFSIKLRFDQCYFEKGFVKRWNIVDMGVIAKNCTFHDCVLPTYEFKEPYSESLLREELVLEACHFVRCTVPASVLWLCQNCTFTDCRFVDDSSKFFIAKKIQVSLGLTGETSTFDLKDSDKVAYKVRTKAKAQGSSYHAKKQESAETEAVKQITALGQRTWTNAAGQKIDAKVTNLTASTITFLLREKPVVYPIEKLSEEDQELIESIRSRVKTAVSSRASSN